MNFNNIDFDFIHELEGFSLKSYVPDPKISQSGVTIASGFDIGQCSKQEIINGFTSDLAAKLLPYIGKTKQAALNYLEDNPLSISQEDAMKIDIYTKASAISRLRSFGDK
jgi:hypothetical protein